MKIAIVCFFFNPDSAIGAVRPENWATWLAEKHEVTVITRENTIATDGDFSFKVVRPRSLLIQLIDWFQKKRVLRRISLANQAKLLKKSTGTKKKLRTGAIFQRMPCLYDFWAVAAFRHQARLIRLAQLYQRFLCARAILRYYRRQSPSLRWRHSIRE